MGAVWSRPAQVEPVRRAQLIRATAVQTGSSNLTFVVSASRHVELQAI